MIPQIPQCNPLRSFGVIPPTREEWEYELDLIANSLTPYQSSVTFYQVEEEMRSTPTKVQRLQTAILDALPGKSI